MPALTHEQHCRRILMLRRLRKALDVPMAAVSIAYAAVIIADLAVDPHSWLRPWLDRSVLALWLVCLAEFGLKLLVAPDRGKFMRRSWFDVLVLVLPFFRILAALRVVRAAGTFGSLASSASIGHGISLFRLGGAARRASRNLGHFMARSRLAYVISFTTVIVFVAATAMVFMERDAPGARFHNFPDALWWSASLVTTVGSDLEPVTGGGKVLAVAMMIYGVTVFGYLVSQATAMFQQQDRAREREVGPPQTLPKPAPPAGEPPAS